MRKEQKQSNHLEFDDKVRKKIKINNFRQTKNSHK
jgi:hypothetical protein